MQAAMAQRRAARRDRRGLPPFLYILAGICLAVLVTAVLALRPSPPTPPAAPLALAQWDASGSLPAGAALNHDSVVLSFSARAGSSPAVPEVEVAPANRRFTGRITARGARISTSSHPAVIRITVPHLRDGTAYHWRVRLRGQDGRLSPWATFVPTSRRAAAAFVVDTTPPTAPVVSSASHPDQMTWYTQEMASLEWSAPRDVSGIAGYAYALDRNAAGVPPAQVMARGTAVTVLIPGDGVWYAHVRALDGAGNWGPAATYVMRVDRHPTAFINVEFARYSFDPDIESESIAVDLSGPARLKVQVLDQYDGSLVRTIDVAHASGPTTVVWDGKDDRGQGVPAGAYRFLITEIDPYGQQAVADYSGIGIVRRRVVVSLSQQRLVAYDGSRAVASTLVTTGNKALPTPLGTFHILEKLTNFTFISPWPKDSPFYYPPSKVQYALMFNWNGFYIHDAPWRSFFGPGSNGRTGTPGQDYTGTHGCVNVPSAFAAWLNGWAPVGTVVQVVP